MKKQLQYGNNTIGYTVAYTIRKSLEIAVHPDLEVVVTAPLDARIEEIETSVKKKARWIQKQKEFFSQFHPPTPPRQYVSGETHLYLGRRYRLKVFESEEKSIKLKGGWIHISTPDKFNSDSIKKQLDAWYRKHAIRKIREYAQPWIKRFKKKGHAVKELQIRRLNKRWGSCTSEGKILLNVELIKASKYSIEYVIVHELCHLITPDHSPAFYETLSAMLPNWDIRKWKLEKDLS